MWCARGGIAAITSELAQYRSMGAQFYIPYVLSCLADGYRQQGKVAEALQVVGEALSLTTTNFDVFWEAELYRLKGTLTLQSKVPSPKSQVEKEKSRVGNAHHRITIAKAGTVGGAHPTREEEAEACFLSAIEIACKQQAKLLELRAVMSLSRLWQQQGKKEEARQMLADIYGWFTEGFDTKDLQEARMLLEELA